MKTVILLLIAVCAFAQGPDLINTVADTASLATIRGGDGQVMYLRQYSSTDTSGGGWFIVRTSSESTGTNYFSHPDPAKQWVRRDTDAWLRTDTQTNITNQTDNIIVDWSFEEMGPTVIAWGATAPELGFWEWRRASDDVNIVYNDPDNALHGNYVAKIDTNTGDIAYQLWLSMDSLTQYTFSYYRKATVGDSGDFYWRFTYADSADAGISGWNWNQAIDISEGWTKHDTTFTSPGGTEKLKLQLYSLDANWSDATLYIDFISLFADSVTPTYVDTKDSPERTMDNKENWYHIEKLEVDDISIKGSFKMHLDPSYSTFRYGNPFTIYNYNNKEVMWIDDAGNVWVNEDILFITRGTDGVSAAHLRHSAGWDGISLGTTKGFTFSMNSLDGTFPYKKITFLQRNQVDSSYTFIPGRTGFGSKSLVSYLYQDSSETVLIDELSKVVLGYDSTVIRNIIKYDLTTGLPLYPQRNQFVFLNDNPVDIDTLAIFNDYVWKYFISDSGAYNAEAIALFARMSTQPSADRKEEMNFLIEALKNYQIWDKLDVLYVFANDTADAGEKLFLNWVGNYSNATNVNSITVAPDTGITSNGSSSYLNTNWQAGDSVNYGRDDACMFIYSRTDTSYGGGDTLRWDYGAYDSTYYLGARILRDNGHSYYHLNIAEFPSSQLTLDSNSTGLFAMNIIPGDARIRLYHNGLVEGTGYVFATATKGMPAYDLYIGALNTEDSPSLYTLRQYSIFGIGAGLIPKQHLQLKKIIEYYLDSLGSGVL